MKSLLGKPKKSICSACPLYRAKHVETWGVPCEFYPNPDGSLDVLFVGEGPGFEEDKEGLPWIGKVGQILRREIKKLNDGGFEGIGFDNITKCRTVKRDGPKVIGGHQKYKDDVPSEETQAICGDYLAKNLRKLQPKTVVLLGNTAVHYFFPHEPGITQCHGKTVTKEGITYIFAYHPSYVARNGDSETLRTWRTDLRKAFRESGRHASAEIDERPADCGVSIHVKTVKKVKWLVREILSLPKGSVCMVDTETENLNRVHDNRILSIQFSWKSVV